MKSMLLKLRIAASLAFFGIVGGSHTKTTAAIYDEAVTIRTIPVTIQPSNPSRTRVGALTLVAGWKLLSSSSQFGGWSALAIEGDRVTALSDAGSILRFRLGHFGRALDATIVRIPMGCGVQTYDWQRDTESLARDSASGDWWIGYEVRNAVCRVNADFTRARSVYAPPVMHGWRRTLGPESMLRLPDGRFLIFAEANPAGGPVSPLLLFDRDPTDPAARVTQLAYRAPAGFRPTDVARLPDGRILVINRRFDFQLFTTALVVIEPAAFSGPAPVQGIVIARFAPPLISDNFEGLSVTVEDDKPYVWLISDDNFMSWQGTYLLKFAIDTIRPQPNSSSPSRSSASAAAP